MEAIAANVAAVARPPSPALDDHMGVDLGQLEHARPRKRTKRACDKCSISRTRCDGQCPCRRCEDYGYTCRYNREIKKRGRVPASLVTSSKDGDSSPSPQDGALVLQSPSPPITSPSNSVTSTPDAAQLPQRHRDSVSSSTTARELPPPPARTHMNLAALLDPTADAPVQPRAARPSPQDDDVDSGGECPSPAGASRQRARFHSLGHRASSSDASLPDLQQHGAAATKSPQLLHRALSSSSADCRYRFLHPVLPYLRGIIPATVACDLLDVYLTEPGSSLFRCASPHVLTRVFRKKAILDPANPRPTTPALLAAMLWCAALTADIVMLQVPGSRSKVTRALYDLATSLIAERDPDRWRRGHNVGKEQVMPSHYVYGSTAPPSTAPSMTSAPSESTGPVDDVLTFILLAVAGSDGEFKSDGITWWHKAVRLALALRLNREDERCSDGVAPCVNPMCSCTRDQNGSETPARVEGREERRRVFWLLYCLDRHLALSFNTVLLVPDSYCGVYAPLPENVWERLDTIAAKDLPNRVLGAPTAITGTGFFEYFLPLMAILGDVIEVHHRRQHPRLGGLDDSPAVAAIMGLLAACERSLEQLQRDSDAAAEYATPAPTSSPATAGPSIKSLISSVPPRKQSVGSNGSGRAARDDRARLQLVAAYSTHILHVLHVLLHGKWDAIRMLDGSDSSIGNSNGNAWLSSPHFRECATHGLRAAQAVSDVLRLDPELAFMPFLFGIYLLHGSFVLLLFADRMPLPPRLLGPNGQQQFPVEQACETLIRAHEVCVVTLSAEFQNFRKVLRSTLYSVRGSGPTDWEEHKARRRALSLYRWTPGSRGLAV